MELRYLVVFGGNIVFQVVLSWVEAFELTALEYAVSGESWNEAP